MTRSNTPTFRKRFGWFGRVRVTCQWGDEQERWMASFRYIWDADAFIVRLLDCHPDGRAVDSDYAAAHLNSPRT